MLLEFQNKIKIVRTEKLIKNCVPNLLNKNLMALNRIRLNFGETKDT